MKQATGSLTKGRKNDGQQDTGLTEKMFLYDEQHPLIPTLHHILMGGEVLGELAVTIANTDALCLCANHNKFKQTACACHH